METKTIEKRKRCKTDELEGVKRLLKLYPHGILSMVSDTYDLWRMCTEYLPALKEQILSRDGKLVIRPDSGDPVEIITGLNAKIFYTLEKIEMMYPVAKSGLTEGQSLQTGNTYTIIKNGKWEYHPKHKGVIELLWDAFGGTVNEKGYKVLDPHVGAIYGDSITLERAEQICERLKVKGFASTNIVFGIGSYTYQYNTRDTFGFAMKATYGEVADEVIDEGVKGKTYTGIKGREIYKDPITDDGTKKSKKGLLKVYEEGGKLVCKDQCTRGEELTGLLEVVFQDSQLIKEQTLEEIRARIEKG